MRNLNQDNITQAVLARLADTPDPRLKEIMTSARSSFCSATRWACPC